MRCRGQAPRARPPANAGRSSKASAARPVSKTYPPSLKRSPLLNHNSERSDLRSKTGKRSATNQTVNNPRFLFNFPILVIILMRFIAYTPVFASSPDKSGKLFDFLHYESPTLYTK